MSADLVGRLADAAIPICGGIFATLVGHRIIGKPPGTDIGTEEWHARYGRRLRVLGPLLIIIGLVLCSISLAAPARR